MGYSSLTALLISRVFPDMLFNLPRVALIRPRALFGLWKIDSTRLLYERRPETFGEKRTKNTRIFPAHHVARVFAGYQMTYRPTHRQYSPVQRVNLPRYAAMLGLEDLNSSQASRKRLWMITVKGADVCPINFELVDLTLDAAESE